MVKRIKLGLLYSYNDNWIGGTYYILNMIRLFNLLPNYKKPTIYIIHEFNTSLIEIKEINYPHIVFKSIEIDVIKLKGFSHLSKCKIFANKILLKFLGFKFFKEKEWLKSIDVLFPSDFNQYFKHIRKKIFWIPDFQDRYYEEFFTKDDLRYRREIHNIISKQENILFSSYDTLNDFNIFYPNTLNNKFIYRFVSLVDQSRLLSNENIKVKYGLDSQSYFFVSNQFWKHKNHIIILKAAKYLLDNSKLNFKIVFSGKTEDYRNPTYFGELMDLVTDYGLLSHLDFLGFIDRIDQLTLMKNSIAVLQPSLFEGWSTVIEDSKALNKLVIASSINVHKEQLGDKGYFFEKEDYIELSNLLHFIFSTELNTPDYRYDLVINGEMNNLYSILKDVSK